MRQLAGILLTVGLSAATLAAQLPPPPPPMPPQRVPGMPQRDDAAPKTGTAVLKGTVVSAENGKPLRRAQVRATGTDPRDGRSVSTDENGVWELRELPAGRYSIVVSKGGYVQLSYGQRRPFEQGRPVELADAQVLDKLDIALPRGSVIAGRVYDEFGDPVAGARVSAMRQRFTGGQRRPLPFGGSGSTDLTDDIGQFRLHGLSPGDYYLSASFGTSMALDRSEDRTGYAPTFYPGTPVLGEAQKVAVTQGQEVLGIAFALVATRVATVSGTVTTSSGKPMANGMVMLMSQSTTNLSPLSGGSMTRPDGTFTVSNVAPGEYTLQTQVMDLESIASIATTGSNRGINVTEAAALPVVVTGENITGLTVVTSPTATASGKVTFAGGVPPGLTPAAVMVMAAPLQVGVGTIGMGGSGLVKEDWTFEVRGLSGRRVIRAPTQGWFLKSVTQQGADVTDTGIEFEPGTPVTGIEIELTREMGSLTGTVESPGGKPVNDYVVVAFSTDSAKWGFMTRFVRTARPDQSGKFTINGLPGGSFIVAALEYLEPGEEQDPEVLERLRPLGSSVTVRDGQPTNVTVTMKPS